ncbi:MAG: hypothetical protein ACOVK2_02590 [Candidatus Fonsibacter sp.]
MTTYKNRYGDVFTFTEDDDNNILWEGDFQYCRIGFPNDYTKAYEAYCNDVTEPIPLEEFKEAVHEYDVDIKEYRLGYTYLNMVDSLAHEIDMVDPSGGPYITRDMLLGSFGFKDYKVKDFQKIDTGYKIITEKCSGCNKPGAIHKMSCSHKKLL